MLSKSRCPHTGVVNYFTLADPLLAVGSVSKTGTPARYVWRCYVGLEACGFEPDLPTAEASLRRAVAAGDSEHTRKARKATAVGCPSPASSYWQKLNRAAAIGSSRSVPQ